MSEPSEYAIAASIHILRLWGLDSEQAQKHITVTLIQDAIDAATEGMVKREDVKPLVAALTYCRCHDNAHSAKIEFARQTLGYAKSKGLV